MVGSSNLPSATTFSTASRSRLQLGTKRVNDAVRLRALRARLGARSRQVATPVVAAPVVAAAQIAEHVQLDNIGVRLGGAELAVAVNAPL